MLIFWAFVPIAVGSVSAKYTQKVYLIYTFLFGVFCNPSRKTV